MGICGIQRAGYGAWVANIQQVAFHGSGMRCGVELGAAAGRKTRSASVRCVCGYCGAAVVGSRFGDGDDAGALKLACADQMLMQCDAICLGSGGSGRGALI